MFDCQTWWCLAVSISWALGILYCWENFLMRHFLPFLLSLTIPLTRCLSFCKIHNIIFIFVISIQLHVAQQHDIPHRKISTFLLGCGWLWRVKTHQITFQQIHSQKKENNINFPFSSANHANIRPYFMCREMISIWHMLRYFTKEFCTHRRFYYKGRWLISLISLWDDLIKRKSRKYWTSGISRGGKWKKRNPQNYSEADTKHVLYGIILLIKLLPKYW